MLENIMEARNKIRICYASLIILIVSVCQMCLCQEETHCAGHEINFTDAQKAQVTDCLDQAGIKSLWKIPVAKLSCFGVCLLEKKELLTPDGKIDHEKSLAYINNVMPNEVKKALSDGIDKCIKDHGEKVKMDNDPNCATFLEVGQCVHDVFIDVCM